MLIKSSNSFISSFIAQLNLGSIRRVRYIKVNYSNISIQIVKLLYEEGVIRLFIIKNNKILIFYKYFKGLTLFKFKMISIPSRKIYWSFKKLSLVFNRNSFDGFYVISTPNGIITSNNSLLYSYFSGEILFKVYIK